MPLAPGSKLGPYEILAPIGRGGMGEVYRALDPRLNREVAIKVSAERFNDRFEREARAVAALNHTNICTLHDVGPNYLVMELIEGDTLAERIKQGPIALDEALKIAAQIADALDAAHTRGIIHRDLKPANIKIKPDGSVKVLDFGLAKIGGTSTPTVATGEDSPTLTMPLGQTEAGVILGTASYMAPEQAKGKPVDKRADIWAFGVVLYEMLTAARPFQGDDLTETLASVVRDKPDLEKAPPEARPLLEACLQKDPAKRLRDIADAMRLISAQPTLSAASNGGVQTPATSKLPSLAAALATLALAALAFLHFRETPPPEPALIQTDLALPAGVTVPPPGAPRLAFSPDGTRLAFNGSRDGKLGIWIRNLQTGSTVKVPGTEGANGVAWAPDGQSLYFAIAGARLMKIEASGGNATSVGAGTSIVFNPKGVAILTGRLGAPIQRISTAGATPLPLWQLDTKSGETGQPYAPGFFQDGQHFLFVTISKDGTFTNLGRLDGTRKRVPQLTDWAQPVFINGRTYVLHTTAGQLFARPFDLAKGDVTGDDIVLASDVPWGPSLAVSSKGLLAFLRTSTRSQLAWFDRQGPTGEIVSTEDARLNNPRISPNQSSVAYIRDEGVLVRNLVRGGTIPITPDSSGRFDWTPDGQSLIIDLRKNGLNDVDRRTVERRADGSAGEKPVWKNRANDGFSAAISHDGRWLVTGGRSTGINLLSRQGGNPVPLSPAGAATSNSQASFSPDGQWIAAQVAVGGTAQIFAIPVPGAAGGSLLASGRVQISTERGETPLWSPTGKEIFFIGPRGEMMSVPVDLKPGSLTPGAPRVLFQTRIQPNAVRDYDVTPDGQRFLIAQSSPDAAPAPLTLVVNWQQLLKTD